jgi:hypothetical protein
MTLGDRIALRIYKLVGTMGFFWACCILATLPLAFPATMPTVQYVSSGYLQLVLLPLIMIGAALLSGIEQQASDARAAEAQAHREAIESAQQARHEELLQRIEAICLKTEAEVEQILEAEK